MIYKATSVSAYPKVIIITIAIRRLLRHASFLKFEVASAARKDGKSVLFLQPALKQSETYPMLFIQTINEHIGLRDIYEGVKLERQRCRVPKLPKVRNPLQKLPCITLFHLL